MLSFEDPWPLHSTTQPPQKSGKHWCSVGTGQGMSSILITFDSWSHQPHMPISRQLLLERFDVKSSCTMDRVANVYSESWHNFWGRCGYFLVEHAIPDIAEMLETQQFAQNLWMMVLYCGASKLLILRPLAADEAIQATWALEAVGCWQFLWT